MSQTNRSDATLFQVRNHHTADCGTPPYIDDSRSNQYLGYFENQHGEQAVSSTTATSTRPSFTWATLAGRSHTQVVDGAVPDLVLSEVERVGVRTCWQAATAHRKEV
jgi:hypothetical protein